MIYATSRLARDRVLAGLYERELRKLDVEIHYANGAGDPTTPEGSLFIGMQQLWDEFERTKLSRETKRGMREASEQGFRAGGRAPYGYRRVLEEMPIGHQGDREKHRVTLEPHPDQAPVVAEIFDLYVRRSMNLRGIADHLNRPGGPPSPAHVDSRRNLRNHWAGSSVRSMLSNATYTGATVWNRLDFATARQHGGAPRQRAREEWVFTEGTHLPSSTPRSSPPPRTAWRAASVGRAKRRSASTSWPASFGATAGTNRSRCMASSARASTTTPARHTAMPPPPSSARPSTPSTSASSSTKPPAASRSPRPSASRSRRLWRTRRPSVRRALSSLLRR